MNNNFTRKEMERAIERAREEGKTQTETVWSVRYLLKATEDQETRIRKLETKTAKLEVKAGVWGFLSGLVPGLAAFLYAIFKRGG